MKLKSAQCFYGYNQYPITNMPSIFDEEAVKREIRKNFPGDSRNESIQVTKWIGIPELNFPPTICVHYPDWSVNITYQET